MKNIESNIELSTHIEVEILKKKNCILHIKDELYVILKSKGKRFIYYKCQAFLPDTYKSSI
ncbi:hypothetical protein CFY87_08275 [Actinobacillus seminis]|uniref:Uncharacterized protein n=1 Tax=Actinobacillus seminis TaxID=722 RepID=A0ABX4FLN7_9PAST|nr:hypothetical protein CFY87_08275 [Actinobacillus seminis]